LDGVKLPEPLAPSVTVPAGLDGVAELSVTVAVQLVEAPTTTEAGVQVTVVVVALAVGGDTVTGSHALLAALLFESPRYVASNPNVPVLLKSTARELGIAPLIVIVTIDTVLEVPEHVPLVTVGKRTYVTVPLG
jgi:hypothetical protein